MKRKILFILLPLLGGIFYVAGSYGHITVYEWAKVKDAEFQATITKNASYHPARLYILAEFPLLAGGVGAVYCLYTFYTMCIRKEEVKQ